MTSSAEGINIAACAQRLDVDNRISLRYYYRIADSILRQADIFRAEKNIIDLYVMLLRFSSLVTETIPHHREYGAYVKSQQVYFKKKLLIALNELEQLKPAVQRKVSESSKNQVYQANGLGDYSQNDSLEWPLVSKQIVTNYHMRKEARPAIQGSIYQSQRAQQFSSGLGVEEQLRKLTLRIPPPKEETLSKHSILGPNGLHGQWQPPISVTGVSYPSIVDLTPIEIPRLQQSKENDSQTERDRCDSEQERSSLELIINQNDDKRTCHTEQPSSLISFETMETPQIIRQPSPPPVLAEVQDLIPAMAPQVTGTECAEVSTLPNGFVHAEAPLQLHLSTAMMEGFMRLAKSNTDKNLETCGVLAGSLKNRKFFVTTLIIPKQESTSDTCHTISEEEIFEVQDTRSLFTLGWIHTHPTQSCFMSSVDVHTHYSYQIMLPEAVAIVMAPRDNSRKHGIFRLTNPGGMSVIRQCQQRGFHPHSQPPDGGPIYKTCTDVYVDPNLKFDVIDLRKS